MDISSLAARVVNEPKNFDASFEEFYKNQGLFKSKDMADPKTQEELLSYLANTDTETRVAGNLLAEMDRVAREIKTSGLSRNAVLVTESFGPNLISESIRRTVTDIPSKTHSKEVILAIESAAYFTRFALLSFILGAIIKIIRWILNNDSSSQGKDGEDRPLAETASDEVRDKSNQLQAILESNAVADEVKEAVVKVFETVKESDDKVDALVAISKKVGELLPPKSPELSVMTACASVTKASVIAPILEAYCENPNDDAAIGALVEVLRRTHVLEILCDTSVSQVMVEAPQIKKLLKTERRPPNLQMIYNLTSALESLISISNQSRELLVSIAKNDGTNTDDSVIAYYQSLDGWCRNHLEGTRTRGAELYSSPFKTATSDADNFARLGSRLIYLDQIGVITAETIKPTYDVIGKMSLKEAFGYLGNVGEVMMKGNRNGKFAGLAMDKSNLKQALAIIEQYENVVNVTQGKKVGKELSAAINEAGAKPHYHVLSTYIKGMDNELAPLVDMMLDHAQAMRSMYTGYAALDQRRSTHNKYCGVMMKLR